MKCISDVSVFAQMKDLNGGEIYMIRNKINNKVYIGQAAKYVSKNNNKWGTEGRWKSHVREAFLNKHDHCSLLNNALRKYKPESFSVTKICDCELSDMDKLEQHYIQYHNSLAPNGYNLDTGGAKGKDSEITRQKKSESGKTKCISDETKINNSLGQLGNRRNTKDRKYQEDAVLPKYIRATRTNGVIVGYGIEFPIGVDKKRYIRKSFNNKNDPQKALELAIKFLEEIKLKYEDEVQKQIQQRKAREQDNKADEKVAQLFPVIDSYIHTLVKQGKIEGYVVKGLVDKNNVVIPPKVFSECTNRWNLHRAKKYLQQVLRFIENAIPIDNWSKVDTVYKCNKHGVSDEHLPKYVNVAMYKGEKCGYVVNGYPVPGARNNKAYKKFTNSKYSMEERYKMALDYLEQLQKDYPLDQPTGS